LTKKTETGVSREDHAEQVDRIDTGETSNPKPYWLALSKFVLGCVAVGEDEAGKEEEEAYTHVTGAYDRCEWPPERKRPDQVVERNVHRGKEPYRRECLEDGQTRHISCRDWISGVGDVFHHLDDSGTHKVRRGNGDVTQVGLYAFEGGEGRRSISI
jgi:hypothetical protein